MMIESVDKYWQIALNACEPVAYTLKDLFQNRWVRFHALPESKRYPENESEYNEVFFRHNTIISELSKENQTLYVVATEYSDKKEHSELEARVDSLLPNNSYWNSVPMHEPDEEEEFKSYWHQYVSKVKWKPGVFDHIFRLGVSSIRWWLRCHFGRRNRQKQAKSKSSRVVVKSSRGAVMQSNNGIVWDCQPRRFALRLPAPHASR